MTVANTRVTQILLKRGNSTVSSTFIGARSEITHDTGPNGSGPHNLRLHDGITPGGHIVSGGVDSTITDALSADITAANIQITSLWANAATQAGQITSLSSNAATQGGQITSLFSNAATQFTQINAVGLAVISANTHMKGYVDDQIANISLTPGPEGPAGTDGTNGTNGLDAKWFWQGAYSDSPRYVEGDIVEYEGSTWRRNTHNLTYNGFPPGPGPGLAYWDYVAQKGATGAQGIQGIQGNVGPQGQQGEKGDQGERGLQGPQGIQGNVGATGPRGFTGNTGLTGDPGPTGERGPTGEQGVSVTLIGNVALPEDLTFSGNAGEAYIVTSTGNLFFWNTQINGWADIGPIVGPQGDPGPQGDRGLTGNIGPAGADGADGRNGVDGTRGSVWFSDAGEPSLSIDGLQTLDFYFNTVDGTTWQFDGSSWVLLTNLTGPQGNIGSTGADGAQGPAGISVINAGISGDELVIYLSDESSIDAGNVRGPQGDTGAAIVQGVTPPDNPNEGTFWYDTDSGRLFVFYENTWVDASIGGDGVGGSGIYGDSNVALLLSSFGSNSIVTTGDVSATHLRTESITSSTYLGIESSVAGKTSGLFIDANVDTGGSSFLYSTANVTIRADNDSGTPRDWKFDTDGILTNPDGIVWRGRSIYSPNGSGINLWDGPYYGPFNGELLLDDNGVTLFANNETQSWQFKNDGELKFPDNTIQTTAYTGGSSFDQSLNTTDDVTFATVNFPTNGLGAPTVSTRSSGTKLVVWPEVSVSGHADYAIGMEDSFLWQSVPTGGTGFKWYAGSSQILRLDGSGRLTATNEIWTKAGDGINGIAFSPNTTDVSGYVKVDGGGNMVAGANGNFQVVSFNNTRLYITDHDSTLSAARDVKLTSVGGNLKINSQGAIWQFGSAGAGSYQIDFPDGTAQTTAWQGNINTTAGYINFTASAVGHSMPDGTITTNSDITGGNIVTKYAVYFPDNSELSSAARLARYDVDGGFYVAENLDVDFDGHFGGNVTIAGNLDIIGNVNFTGNINQVTGNQGEFTGDPLTGVGALYAGKAGFTAVPSTIFQTTAYVNGYIQNNFQNLHPGNQSSTEWVATADNGTDTTNYLDMGIAGGGWDGTQDNSVGTAANTNDAYVYTVGNVDAGTGGNMILGTIQPGKSVKILVGGSGSANVVATFNSSGAVFKDTITGDITGSAGSATYVTGLTGANVTAALGYTPAAQADVTGANAAIITANTAMKVYVDSKVAASSYGDANVAVYLSTYAGNVGAGNVNLISSNFNSRLNLPGGSAISGIASSTGTILLQPNIAAASFPGVQIGGSGLIKGPGGGSSMTLSNTNTSFTVPIVAPAYSSTSTTTGGIQCAGGIGVSGNINVGGNIVVSGNSAISMPNRPAFRVYGTSGADIAATANISSTQGATVDYNQGSYYNSTTGVFTAPVAGLYHAWATVRTGTLNSLCQAAIFKNTIGTNANVSVAFWETDTNTGTARHFSMTGYTKLAVGDLVTLRVVAGNVNFDSNDSWGITYVG